MFEKDSTRTRCAFEVAAYDQGAHVTFIGPTGSHMGHKETPKDTARVLGRMYDAIEFRGFAESVADELAKWAGVPVYNGLTDEWHPTQILADFLTIREHVPQAARGRSPSCYLGDARFNMADTLHRRRREARDGRPDREPEGAVAAGGARQEARSPSPRRTAGGSRSPRTSRKPCPAATCYYTDVWVSMGEADDVWDGAHPAAHAVPRRRADHGR